MHIPRTWRESERRIKKEVKKEKWKKSEKGQVSAPLIIDPVAGNMSSEMKVVCKQFENLTRMRVVVQTRAGRAIEPLAKSEPLKDRKCGQDECFPCSTRGGMCEKNGAGYLLRCETCQRAGRPMQVKQEGMDLVEG